ncbi:MAG: hypothetical protein ACXIUL_02525 [Wenzhouxiangella sp.]
MKFRNGARAALLFFLVFTLVGCATSTRSIPTRPGDPENLPDEYGLVAFKVISNTERLTSRLVNWTGAFAIDLNDSEKRYFLQGSSAGLNSSRVFVGAMPPGEYAVVMLQSHLRAPDAQIWLNAPLSADTGTFSVDQGRLTSLGTLVYQPLGWVREDNESRHLYVIARFEDYEPLEHLVAEAYPEAWEGIQTDLILGWDPDENDPMRQEMADRLRRVPRGMERHRLDDGRAVLTAPMGQILVRDSAASWRRIDSGQTRHIASLTDRAEGGYLASGERGLVLTADHLDGPWQHRPGPSTQENIFWIHSNADGSAVALTERHDRIRLYSVDPDFSQWQSLAEFRHRNPMLSAAEAFHALATEDGRVMVFGDSRRTVFDPSTGAVESHEDRNLTHLSRQPDGTLTRVPDHFWSRNGRPQFSVDDGETWQDLRPIRSIEIWRVSGPVFILPNQEFAAISNRSYRPAPTQRMRYDEHNRIRLGDTEEIRQWGVALEEGCDQLVPLFSDPGNLFVSCRDGRLLRSTDGGQSWNVDFDQIFEQDEVSETPRGNQTI